MARIGPTAERQIDELALDFWRENRPEATQKLRDAVASALSAIENPATRPGTHPAPYPSVARYEILWLKLHIYWFGYGRAADGEMTIANVIWDRADLPSRVADFQEAASRETSPDGR